MKSIISVVGTTGVGKSALASKIAMSLQSKGLSAGIVNCDSMQIYKGLDVVTNKPDAQERAVCDHYLFDFLDTHLEFSVGEYTLLANSTITSMLDKNQTPLLVGGTNYYMQSLLWNESLISIDSMDKIGLDNKNYETAHNDVKKAYATKLKHILTSTDPRYNDAFKIQIFCENEDLHGLLVDIDPKMSKKWHPSDYRKIRRSLEIYYTTGKTQSEWYSLQDKKNLRFPIVMIWLYGSPDMLDQRLDARVDEMIRRGLIQEIKEMRQLMKDDMVVGGEKYLANGGGYTRGILQAIGFKEFHDYFEALENPSISKSEIDKLFNIGVEEMKLATRQYARKQINWIKNKLGPAMIIEHEKQNAAFYVIDATGIDELNLDPKSVTEEVINSAIELVHNFQKRLPNKDPSTLAPNLAHLLQPAEKEDSWDMFYCKYCLDPKTSKPKVFMGKKVWTVHEKSRSHKKQVHYASKPRPAKGDKEAWLEFQK